MAVKAYNTITLISIDDVNISMTEPENPVVDQLWLDTSKVPNELMRYDGTGWVRTQYESVEELDPSFKTELDEVLASIDESIDSVSGTLGRIDTEQRISVLDRLGLQAERDRIQAESERLTLILADVDDSELPEFTGAIADYEMATTAMLLWLTDATTAPNFGDVDTTVWADLQADYLETLDRVNRLALTVETQHRVTLTSQMLDIEQVQGQFQERLRIDAQGMTINVDDANALTIRKDGMRIFVEGVERAEFTSSGFSADQGRVDVLQVGAHIVSRDGDFTVWRPI